MAALCWLLDEPVAVASHGHATNHVLSALPGNCNRIEKGGGEKCFNLLGLN